MSDAVASRPFVDRLRHRELRALALAAGAALLLLWLLSFVVYRFTHSITKDAFVDSHLVNVAPQVAGAIVEVRVQEQQQVRAGQALVRIDPSTYDRNVEVAAAKLAAAEEGHRKAEADLAVLVGAVPRRIAVAEQRLEIATDDETKAVEALEMVKRDVDKGISAAEHAVDGAKAAHTMASEDYDRYGALSREGSVPQRRFQEASRAFKESQAGVKVAEAKLGQAEAGKRQISIAEQQRNAARHAVTEAQAALELARLGNLEIEAAQSGVSERASQVEEARRTLELARVELGYTSLAAPFDAIIARKWRHLGDYAHVGDPVFSLYNPALLYVTANLEETLLEGVAPGNEVRLDVDAFDAPFRGRVLWIGSATDAKFSLIPRDVSSGEFTYIVQRVPVRIWIEDDERRALLKPGLSVTVSIRHGKGDPEWAAQALQREAQIEGITEPEP